MRIGDYLYPRVRCAICQKEIYDNRILCEACSRSLDEIKRPHDLVGSLVRGHVVYRYQDPARQLILNFKYQDKRYLGAFIAQKMLEVIASMDMDFEVLVPVPAHYERRWIRGYNQSEILARLISRGSGIPMDAGYLKRTMRTVPMKELNRQERIEMIGDAFRISEKKTYKRLLIIDDIYTTGATVDSCGRALYDGGADEMAFVAFSGND